MAGSRPILLVDSVDSRQTIPSKQPEPARTEAGIPGFQLRDLRHSCARRLSDVGEDLVTVAEILGHTDIRMTKRYSHAMQERKREALEKLAFLSPRQPDAKNGKKENGRVRALP